MAPFTAAPHQDVLLLLFQIALLLFAARGLGEVALRLGQPSVVGEIMAGIILGPSLLSGAFPALGGWIVPQTPLGGYLLEVVSLLGALFLLLITGLETDLGLIRQHARTAMGVSFGGIIVMLLAGFTLGWNLPDDLINSPDEGHRLVFASFVAIAMTISSIPVIAKVLMEMNLMRRDIGQTIIAAGMSDDTIGWMLLSIVAGLAGSGVVSGSVVLMATGSVVVFMVASFTVVRWLAKRALDFVQDEFRSSDRLVTLVIVFTMGWAAITHVLGLEPVLGAFVMGIVFGQMPRLPEDVHKTLVTMSVGVFTPIFFAVAGLKVNARALMEPRLLAIAVFVIAIATVGKIVGTYLGARIIGGREHWTALSFGAGLNARGAIGIIVATIGLELGILSQDMFSILVVMAMVTSLMAPPALRWVLARVTPGEEELERLRREEYQAGSRVAKIHRVLLPVRLRRAGDAIHSLEGKLIERLNRHGPLALTLFNVARPGERAVSSDFLDEIATLFPDAELTKKVVESNDSAAEILREATKNYGLLILGATETPRGVADAIFHPLVDRLVRLAPCPTVVVKGGLQGTEWNPRRILVPTNGSTAARNAAELAFRLADKQDVVVLLNVIRSEEADIHGALRHDERRFITAQSIVRELSEVGEAQEVRTLPLVRVGNEPDVVILEVADEIGCGLCVMGTDVRPASDRLFLGPRVENILEGATCPVLVFNSA